MPLPIRFAALAAILSLAATARAEVPADFLRRYSAEAQRTRPAFAPAAPRGRAFFESRHGREWSCASCHRDARVDGEHAATGKRIAPLSPLANPRRFTDAAKVEKWFRRNCRDVVARECSPAEKADVLAWLLAGRR